MINNLSCICKVPSSSSLIVCDWVTKGQESWRNTSRISPIADMCVFRPRAWEDLAESDGNSQAMNTWKKRGFYQMGLVATSSLTSSAPTPKPNAQPFSALSSPFSQHTIQLHANPLWLFSSSGLSLILVFNPFFTCTKPFYVFSRPGKRTLGL